MASSEHPPSRSLPALAQGHSRRPWLPAALFVAALLTSAWAWWLIAWPVAVLESPAKHAGHFALVYVHMIGGTIMLTVGAANVYVGWTRRAFRYHRTLGYVYLGGGAGAVVAFVLALSNVHDRSGAPFAFGLGQAGEVGISTATLALAWLTCSAMALRAARYRRFEAHRGWMIRSYVLAWTFVLCRLASRVPGLATLGGESGASLVWVSWVVPLIVCEVALQWREAGRKPAPPAARTAVPIRLAVLLALLLPTVATAQASAPLSPGVQAAIAIADRYDVRPDVPYDTTGGKRLVLDAYVPYGAAAEGRALVYVHGGGWVWDTKERNALELLPFLAQGWTVVSVEYRRADEALAPAAVADFRCAVRWVAAHADTLGADPRRLVVAGHSAGGHLALMAALPPAASNFDRDCPWPEAPPVAAVVNWFGITDVADLLGGAHERDFAVRWVGAAPGAAARAARVSPLAYVHPGAPPVLTVHGDADATVPFAHAVRLHEALDRAGVPNRLVRVRGGDHGGFASDDLLDSYRALFAFVRASLRPG